VLFIVILGPAIIHVQDILGHANALKTNRSPSIGATAGSASRVRRSSCRPIRCSRSAADPRTGDQCGQLRRPADAAALDVNLAGQRVVPGGMAAGQRVPFVFCSGYEQLDSELRRASAAA